MKCPYFKPFKKGSSICLGYIQGNCTKEQLQTGCWCNQGQEVFKAKN